MEPFDCILNISLHPKYEPIKGSFILHRTESIDCEDVASILCRLKLEGCVIPTVSSVNSLHPSTAGEFLVEKGCSIKMFVPKISDIYIVWETLKNEFNLSCAHIKYKDFDGCLEEWMKIYK